MTICPTHQISDNLCGCKTPEPTPKLMKEQHRDFSEHQLNSTVRLAGRLRQINICPLCNCRGVRVEDAHPKLWPFRDKLSKLYTARRLRVAFVHDAVVSGRGYVAGSQCVVYEEKKKR